MSKPLISKQWPKGLLLNPDTRYVPAVSTTVERLRGIFEEERKRIAKAKAEAVWPQNIRKIKT